jgi:hypothetical protein
MRGGQTGSVTSFSPRVLRIFPFDMTPPTLYIIIIIIIIYALLLPGQMNSGQGSFPKAALFKEIGEHWI